MDPIEEIGSSLNYNKPAKKKKRTSNYRPASYMKQEVDFQKTPFLFFPPGKEFLFLGIYFVTLPYIVGLLFLFFYVSNGEASIFGAVSTDSNFFLIWIIGYELLAAFIVMWIVKNAIMFSFRNAQSSRRSTHQPKRRHRR